MICISNLRLRLRVKSNICPVNLLLKSWLAKPEDGKRDEESDSKKIKERAHHMNAEIAPTPVL